MNHHAKIYLILLVIVFLLIPAFNIEARSGCCSWHGGVCGCSCCDGTPLSSTCLPYYPECSGGSIFSPSYNYDYDFPSYSSSIPDCPFNSSYDSISGSCKCYSGYVASGGKCVSASQYCTDKYGYGAAYSYLEDACECKSGYEMTRKDYGGGLECVSCSSKYGFGATYDYLTNSCECSSGYVWGTDFLGDSTCISGNQYCRDKYGYNSSYDAFSKSCKCDYGYVFDSSDQCVRKDDYCQDLYGYHSKYDTLAGGCVCDDGYEFKNNECVETTPIIYSFYPQTVGAGESVTVSGNNFGDYKGDVILNTLSFGTLGKISSLNIKSWSDSKIKFVVPEDKEPDKYYIRIRPSSLFSSKEAVSKNKLEVLAPLPEISSVYPLDVRIGEEVTINGENFGGSKYGDLKLYVGSTKVDSFNIISWWDDRIVFEATDDLESGYISLKEDKFLSLINIQGPYLEILKAEEDKTFVFSFSPSPTFNTNPTISEGALIRAKSGIDIYIVKYVGSKKFKRLILSPSVFNNYGHLRWGDVIDVDQSVLNSFTTSELVKAVGDEKVYKLYPMGDTGEKRWVKTGGAFTRMGFDWDAIYEINQFDRDSYITGTPLE